MARRGPKPNPISLLRLQATYEPSRHDRRQFEPVALGELADDAPPTWLTERQRAIWQGVIARAPKGILRAIDAELLAAYCELVDRPQRAAEAQARLDAGEGLPLLVRGASGLALSPYLRILNQTTMLMLRLQSEFGFTPAGRAGLGTPAEPRAAGADNTWSVLRRFPVVDGGKAGDKR